MRLYVLGDVHHGSSTFNEKLFEDWLGRFRKDKSKKAIILNGDLVDMLDSDRYYKPANVPTLNESIDYIVDNLYPFRKHIIANLPGNHENRAVKKFDLDIAKIIGDQLDVETTSAFHEDVEIGKDKFIRVFAQHTAPVSKSTLLAMRRFIDACNGIDAELFIGGHNHRAMGVSKIFRGLNYKPYRKHYVFNGCFLNYKGSYGEGKYDYLLPCYPVVDIHKKTKNVKFEIYYEPHIFDKTNGDDYL